MSRPATPAAPRPRTPFMRTPSIAPPPATPSRTVDDRLPKSAKRKAGAMPAERGRNYAEPHGWNLPIGGEDINWAARVTMPDRDENIVDIRDANQLFGRHAAPPQIASKNSLILYHHM